jgi:hypothetical protein
MLATRMLFVIGGSRGLAGHAGAATVAAAGCQVAHGASAAAAAQVESATPALALTHSLAATASASVTLAAALAPPGPAVVLLADLLVRDRLHAAVQLDPRLAVDDLRLLPRLLAHTGTLPCL